MNQNYFIELTNQIIGTRTKKEFCSQINITPEYLSRLLSPKNKTVPSIKLLENMISASENPNITLDDLKQACEYPTNERTTPHDIALDIITQINKFNIELPALNHIIIPEQNNIEIGLKHYFASVQNLCNNKYDVICTLINSEDCQNNDLLCKLLNNNESYISFKLTFYVCKYGIRTLSLYGILAGHWSKNNYFYINQIFYNGQRIIECNALDTKATQELSKYNIEIALMQYVIIVDKYKDVQLPPVHTKKLDTTYTDLIKGYGIYLDNIPPNFLQYAYNHRYSWANIVMEEYMQKLQDIQDGKLVLSEQSLLDFLSTECQISGQNSWQSVISNTITNESDFDIANYSNIDTSYTINRPMIVAKTTPDNYEDKTRLIGVLLEHAKELGLKQIEYCYQQQTINPQSQIYKIS